MSLRPGDDVFRLRIRSLKILATREDSLLKHKTCATDQTTKTRTWGENSRVCLDMDPCTCSDVLSQTRATKKNMDTKPQTKKRPFGPAQSIFRALIFEAFKLPGLRPIASLARALCFYG